MSDFDWPDVKYFQAKFGWERVKASKVILNYSKLSRFDYPFGGGLPWVPEDIFFLLTRLRREPSVSIRKKYPLEPRVGVVWPHRELNSKNARKFFIIAVDFWVLST